MLRLTQAPDIAMATLWRDLLERRERLLHGAISSMEQAKTPVDGSQLALYRRELSYVRQELEKFH